MIIFSLQISADISNNLKPLSDHQNLKIIWSKLTNTIKNGEIKKFQSLISEGFSINTISPDPWKQSLLHVVSSISNKHPLSSIQIASQLITGGVDPNSKMTSGLTPLHEVARSGSLQLAKLLINRGASVNPKVLIKNCLDPDYDLNNMTPTDIALKFKNNKVLNFLRQHGGMTNTEIQQQSIQ